MVLNPILRFAFVFVFLLLLLRQIRCKPIRFYRGGEESKEGRRWWRYDGQGWYRRCEWKHDRSNQYSIPMCRNQDRVYPGNLVLGPAVGAHFVYGGFGEKAPPQDALNGPFKWDISGDCDTNSEYCTDGNGTERNTYMLIIDDHSGPRWGKCKTMPHGSNYYGHLNSYCHPSGIISWAEIPIDTEIEGIGFKLFNTTEPVVPDPNGGLASPDWPIPIGDRTVDKPRDPQGILDCKGATCNFEHFYPEQTDPEDAQEDEAVATSE